MIEDLEEGFLCTPRFFMGQDGDAITAIADDQVVFEAAVEVPSCISEALL